MRLSRRGPVFGINPTGVRSFVKTGTKNKTKWTIQLFWLDGGVLANRFYIIFGWRGCWPIGFTTILVGGDVGQQVLHVFGSTGDGQKFATKSHDDLC